jgi:hypothetical protein
VLAGEPQRAVAPGDDALHQLRVHREGWRALAGIEHAQPPARPRADVEEPSAALEPFGDGIHRLRDARQLGLDRRSDLRILGVDDREHLQRGELIEALAGGIASLRGQLGEVGLVGRGHSS